MRIFKTKWLARFAKHEGIADSSLREAVARAERGLIDADLGGGLIKQRVARRGKGRSGGHRGAAAHERIEYHVAGVGEGLDEELNQRPGEGCACANPGRFRFVHSMTFDGRAMPSCLPSIIFLRMCPHACPPFGGCEAPPCVANAPRGRSLADRSPRPISDCPASSRSSSPTRCRKPAR